MARRCPALLVISLWGLLGFSVERTARAEDNERYVLRAELGVEYDTNAHRTEHLNDTANPENVRSPLGRGVASASLSDVIAPGHAVALSATAAAKLFADQRARDEDVAVAQSSAEWRMNLGPHATLGLAGNYYEAFQRSELGGQAVRGSAGTRRRRGGRAEQRRMAHEPGAARDPGSGRQLLRGLPALRARRPSCSRISGHATKTWRSRRAAPNGA